MMYITSAVLLIVALSGAAHCEMDWGYDEGIEGVLGPMEWKKGYPRCGKKEQSPINVYNKVLTRAKFLHTYLFVGFEQHLKNANVSNDGLLVELKSDDIHSVTIDKVAFGSNFTLEKIQFHWGQNDSVGSETTFNAKSYPFTMEMLFFKTEEGSFDACVEQEYGLLNMQVLFKISSEDNMDISDVTDSLDTIQKVNTENIISQMKYSLDGFLPANKRTYYAYAGTQSTPPCTRLLWVILKDPVTISDNQLDKFRQLDGKYGGKLTHNYRPVYPLEGRVEFYRP